MSIECTVCHEFCHPDDISAGWCETCRAIATIVLGAFQANPMAFAATLREMGAVPPGDVECRGLLRWEGDRYDGYLVAGEEHAIVDYIDQEVIVLVKGKADERQAGSAG